MSDAVRNLYEVVLQRKKEKQEGSYTCYLFEQGRDKILKKVGEEASEVIIAAKNGDNAYTQEEICDLLYHLMVLMADSDIPLEKIEEILEERACKIGNLKQFKKTDRNT